MKKQLYDKKYYLCKGYKSEISNKKIIYYHQPKSGGTSITNIFLSLFQKPYRILGTQTKNDFSISCYENFEENFDKIQENNYDFISGHIQYLDFFKERTSITTIRDPLERAISHYNMLFKRKIINAKTKLEECFKKELIPKNPITQMFSCTNSNKINLKKNHRDLAIQNLKKIDLVVSLDNIDNLINYLISVYDLPNILYQRPQQNKINYFKINKMNQGIILDYNKFDIEIFNKLKKNKFFFNFPKTKQVRSKFDYFIYSIDYKINDRNILITQKPKFDIFVNFLKEQQTLIKKIN